MRYTDARTSVGQLRGCCPHRIPSSVETPCLTRMFLSPLEKHMGRARYYTHKANAGRRRALALSSAALVPPLSALWGVECATGQWHLNTQRALARRARESTPSPAHILNGHTVCSHEARAVATHLPSTSAIFCASGLGATGRVYTKSSPARSWDIVGDQWRSMEVTAECTRRAHPRRLRRCACRRRSRRA